MRYLLLTAVFLCSVVSLAADNPKLSANLDGNATPQIALEGAGLKAAKNLNFVSGHKGKACYFNGKEQNLPVLEYKLGSALYGKEWSIALWLKLDTGKKPLGYLFRTYSTGGWKQGDVTASFDQWGNLGLSRFDADGNRQSCRISSSVVPRGEWVHLVFTENNGRAKIFINGYEAKYITNHDVEKAGPKQKGIRLGCSSIAPEYYLHGGTIDDFQVFNKSLNSDEIKSLMASSKNDGGELVPQLYLPLENKIDPQSKSGMVGVGADRVLFQSAVIGQGACMVRHGYDSKSSMSLKDISGICSSAMTVNLYFIPNWDGRDKGVHGLLHAVSEDFSWMLIVRNSRLEFIVTSKEKENLVSLSTEPWMAKKPVHLAAAYSSEKKKMYLALDGKIIAETVFNLKTPNSNASLIVGDYADCDMYRRSQAEGVIDEVRIFDSFLTAHELKQEMDRKKSVRLKKDESTNAPIPFHAVTPKETELWNLNGVYTQQTHSRKKITLNALWRFQLTAEGKPPLVSQWHYLAVPGRYSGQKNGYSDHQFLIRKPDFSLGGQKQLWENRPTEKYFNSWFERAFKADQAWQGKQVSLRVDELSPSGSAQVYLNGKLIGNLANACSYKLPIPSDILRFDDDNFLLLHLSDSGPFDSWRGIKGDVWLDICDRVVLSNPQIITTVNPKIIKISADVSNSTASSCKLRLEAVIKGKNGVKSINSDSRQIPANSQIKLDFARNWSNAELWNFQNPCLYTCSLYLKDDQGNIIDEYPPFQIGFREFCIKGSDYYLNGEKVHLRNNDAWMNSSSDYSSCLEQVRELKKIGYNSVRGNFNDKDLYMDNVIRACDEAGLLLFLNVFGVTHKEYTSWNNPTTRNILEKQMSSRIVEWRNHPSIVMWYMSVNFLGYGWDYHPKKMMDGYLPPLLKDQYKVCLEAVKIMEKYDSTRPYFFQAGGAFGPIINSNAYFCWWPQAERAAWAHEWNKNPAKPLHIIETSFPYWRSFFGMDLRFSTGKPLFVVENAARFFGENAYRNIEKPLQDITIQSRVGKADKLKWLFFSLSRNLKLVADVRTRLLVDTTWHWRADGISGLCPFAEMAYGWRRKSPHASIHVAYSEPRQITDFRQPGWHPDFYKRAAFLDIDFNQPLPYRDALKKSFTPLLVFFGGTPQNPISQAADYPAGQPIDKALIVLNDTLTPQPFVIDWQLLAPDGNVLRKGQFKQTLTPGEIVRAALPLQAPATNRPITCRLVATAASPRDITIDPIDLHIFPAAPAITSHGKIALYDPRGLSAKELKRLKVKVADAVKLSSLTPYSLLIVGRESFGADFAAWAKKVGLASWLESGRGNVIMLEQQPDALRMLGLDTNAIYARETFKTPAGQTLLPGLTDATLRYWQGHGTLAPQHQPPSANTEENVASPLWHWSNHNMVCAYPIRRPSAGACRNLVVCGKDLIYTPLLEIACGRGKVLFCQLEVSGRDAHEPAADVLLADLINHYSKAVADTPAKRPLQALNPTDPVLATLGFDVKPLPSAALPADAIILVNRPLQNDELSRLTRAVEAGADAVVTTLDPALTRQLNLTTAPVKFGHFDVTPVGRPFLGDLSARDRYFRYPLTCREVSGGNVRALTQPAVVSELPSGKGRYFFVLIDPADLDKFFSLAAKIDWNSSNLWAESLLRERCNDIWTTLLTALNAPAQTLTDRLIHPILPAARISLDGAWDFRTDPDDLGLKQHWENPDQFARISGWRKLRVPGYWESQGITQRNPRLPVNLKSKGYDGYAWYRTTVELPPELRDKPLRFHADFIDDFDWVYVNGVQIGHIGETTDGYWQAPRNYPIPARLLKNGRLDIAVRVYDARGNGGLSGSVSLQAATTPNPVSPFPYYVRPMPGYNTESAIRW